MQHSGCRGDGRPIEQNSLYLLAPLSHLVLTLEKFQHLGDVFISLRARLDLASPCGRVMFAVITAMAEFERELIRERINAGLRRAQAQGKHLGRPPRVLSSVAPSVNNVPRRPTYEPVYDDPPLPGLRMTPLPATLPTGQDG